MQQEHGNERGTINAERYMGKKIAGIIVLAAVIILGFLMWKRHNETQELANGDVHCDGCMTPEEHARFLKENAGETPDGASDRKNKTAREEAATDFQDAAGPGGERFVSDSAASASGAAGTSGVQDAAGVQSSGIKPQPALTLANGANVPATDTLPPNPQTGASLAGSGTYQWYRQGNLTWRINTATGRSCIIYATMEEWRKPIVSSHGCGRKA